MDSIYLFLICSTIIHSFRESPRNCCHSKIINRRLFYQAVKSKGTSNNTFLLHISLHTIATIYLNFLKKNFIIFEASFAANFSYCHSRRDAPVQRVELRAIVAEENVRCRSDIIFKWSARLTDQECRGERQVAGGAREKKTTGATDVSSECLVYRSICRKICRVQCLWQLVPSRGALASDFEGS